MAGSLLCLHPAQHAHRRISHLDWLFVFWWTRNCVLVRHLILHCMRRTTIAALQMQWLKKHACVSNKEWILIIYCQKSFDSQRRLAGISLTLLSYYHTLKKKEASLSAGNKSDKDEGEKSFNLSKNVSVLIQGLLKQSRRRLVWTHQRTFKVLSVGNFFNFKVVVGGVTGSVNICEDQSNQTETKMCG